MELEPDDDGAVEIDDEDVWQSDNGSSSESDDDAEAGPTTSGLHPRDLDNFLKLAMALTRFLSDDLTAADVKAAEDLLQEYCLDLLEVSIGFGPSLVRCWQY